MARRVTKGIQEDRINISWTLLGARRRAKCPTSSLFKCGPWTTTWASPRSWLEMHNFRPRLTRIKSALWEVPWGFSNLRSTALNDKARLNPHNNALKKILFPYFVEKCFGLNVRHPNACVEILSPKDDDIRRWGLWEMFRSWGGSPPEWEQGLSKRLQRHP